MTSPTEEKVSSGTSGLDQVLHGGLFPGQTTILSGGPGTGKTIFALQFLAAGDNGLYIGFEEREQELRRNAEALGIDLSNVSILDLSASSDRFFSGSSYTVFPSEEVEGTDLIEEIGRALDRDDLDRLVIDPLSELRAVLPDDYQFRRNISSLFNALADRGVTTVGTIQPGQEVGQELQHLGNATIELTRETNRRMLEVTKYRGSETAAGVHTFRIHSGEGIRVYPKLVPGDHHYPRDRTQLHSGLDTLDAMLGGGLERGSVTVISGPSGVGKTTTGSYFLQAAAKRGERALAFLFEELEDDYRYRSAQLGMDIDSLVSEGRLEVEEVEALVRTPDEFAYQVRQAVEERDVEFVLLDGTSGYRQGLRGDYSPLALRQELHALCRYLKRMGVTVVLIEEIDTLTGEFTPTAHEISYLADNLLFLRYFEADGSLRKAIGVLKKRYSGFEPALRELSIGSGGLTIGDPLHGYHGLLTGIAESLHE